MARSLLVLKAGEDTCLPMEKHQCFSSSAYAKQSRAGMEGKRLTFKLNRTLIVNVFSPKYPGWGVCGCREVGDGKVGKEAASSYWNKTKPFTDCALLNLDYSSNHFLLVGVE
jgi:hypothetical protein